jgi:hypothetical protein
MEPEGSLPHSQEHATCPYPEPQIISPRPRICIVFRNMVIFYGEELLAPRPIPKLEGHPLSAVRDCLFNVFAATLHIRRPFLHPQPEDTPCRGDRDPLIMAQRLTSFTNNKITFQMYYYICCSFITNKSLIAIDIKTQLLFRAPLGSMWGGGGGEMDWGGARLGVVAAQFKTA